MKLIYTTLLVSMIMISCSDLNSTTNQKQLNDDPKSTDTLPPVETEEANTDFKPAFEGQTRVAGVKTTSSYTTEVITEELNKPWGIAVLPDGRLLITEKEGVMRIVNTESGEVSEAITRSEEHTSEL